MASQRAVDLALRLHFNITSFGLAGMVTLVSTVQLGYCDSDVTVCLLFWNMPIVQDGDVKFQISDIDIIYKHSGRIHVAVVS